MIRGTEERRYSVEGEIVFEFTPAMARECPKGLARDLQDEVRATDLLYPWKDKSDYDGAEVPSIGFLGEGQNQYHNVSTPELHVWYRIVPGIQGVRKGQIYAYEKYLEKLAEKLAFRCNAHGATSVRSVFRVGSVKFFKGS